MRSVVLAAVLGTGLMPGTGRAYEPRVNYQLQCMGCHLVDGAGESGRVPSFRETFIPLSMLPEGRQFVIRVPGVAQSPLADDEIAALLNWIARNLSEGALPAGFEDYTATEVRGLRRQPLAQVATLRAELLKRIAESAGTR